MQTINPNEAGEVGERFAQEILGLKLHPHGAFGPDAEKDGKTYEIKTRVLQRRGRKSLKLSSYRLMGLKDNFDLLVIVALSEEGKRLKISVIARSAVKDLKNARLSLINSEVAEVRFQAEDWADFF